MIVMIVYLEATCLGEKAHFKLRFIFVNFLRHFLKKVSKLFSLSIANVV